MAAHGSAIPRLSIWLPHRLFPAGPGQPLGVPTVGAAILGCLIYAILIVAGAAMCEKPWFRRFVIGFGLLVLSNIAGCRWGNPKDLEGFSQAPLRAVGKTA